MDLPSLDSYLDGENESNLFEQNQPYPNVLPQPMNLENKYEIKSFAPEFEQYHQPHSEQNYMINDQLNNEGFYNY